MMKSSLGHIQININPKNMQFYKDLFNFMDWKVLYDEPTILGVEDEHNTSLWFTGSIKSVSNDYDGFGVNHLGISVPHQEYVDETVTYIKSLGIFPLFETPCHRPEFCSKPDSTYYQVMFESPDKLLFEVVYTGLKS